MDPAIEIKLASHMTLTAPVETKLGAEIHDSRFRRDATLNEHCV